MWIPSHVTLTEEKDNSGKYLKRNLSNESLKIHRLDGLYFLISPATQTQIRLFERNT